MSEAVSESELLGPKSPYDLIISTLEADSDYAANQIVDSFRALVEEHRAKKAGIEYVSRRHTIEDLKFASTIESKEIVYRALARAGLEGLDLYYDKAVGEWPSGLDELTLG